MRPHQHFRVVHGYRRAYLHTGSGPAVLLVHGVGESSATWDEAVPLLARTHTVVAPDLLGHGDSDKPRADYSLGGFANGLRDLLVLLGIDRATVVGHSLGGGVALQFAYQYPHMCERLVLVASGGLGAEVSPLLRAAALPGAGLAFGITSHAVVRRPVIGAARIAARLGLLDQHDVREVERIWSALGDAATRSAFLRTLRGVVDVRGQAVTSRDRLYLTANIPMMVVWGDRDPVLPIAHARAAVADLPGCRLEVVSGAGHLPHQTNPRAFVAAILNFIGETQPSVHDATAWREALARGASGQAKVRPPEPDGPAP